MNRTHYGDIRQCNFSRNPVESDKMVSLVSTGKSIRRSVVVIMCCIVPCAGAVLGDNIIYCRFSFAENRCPVDSGEPQFRAYLLFGGKAKTVKTFSAPNARHDGGPHVVATRADVLQSPIAVTTDSHHRLFVSDAGAGVVHIFDFVHSTYSVLERGRDRFGNPSSLAVDNHDNVYVIDMSAKNVVIYDSTGRFQSHFWKLREGEASLEDPTAIAIDRDTGLVYVCDRQRHLVMVMDDRGRLISNIGKIGGGSEPGEFRLPTLVVVEHGELFVLDAGNARIQILDTAGNFRQAIYIAYAGRGTGLAVDNQSNIYVSNPVLNHIQVFGQDGQLLDTLDLSTIKNADFIRPSSLWVDSRNCLYVVDSQSNRIGLFQIGGPDTHRCR